MPKPWPSGKAEILPMKNDHADQAGEHARRRAASSSFSSPASGHHHDGEQRRRGIQDRGQPARDIGLPDHDQRERQNVVEEARSRKRAASPTSPAASLSDRSAAPAAGSMRRERHPQEDQRQRRQFAQRHAVEEERAAPQDREQAEQRPVPAINTMHQLVVMAAHIRAPADLCRRIAQSAHPISDTDARHAYFGRDTISIILPSSSSGPWALARA